MSAAAAIAAVEDLAVRVVRAEDLLRQVARAPVDETSQLVRLPAELLAEIRAHFA